MSAWQCTGQHKTLPAQRLPFVGRAPALGAASATAAPTPSLAVAAPEPAASLGSSEGELEPEPTTAEAEAATGGQLTLSEVVVGLMTAQRFHGTRCRMQSATWLQRMRRVVFFTDNTADASGDNW